jgi:multiple sugar transport system substrate-binding protein
MLVLGSAGALTATVLAACGAGGSSGADNTGPSNGGTPAAVEWMVWDQSPVWGRVAEQFTRQSSGMTATVTQAANNSDALAEKLQAAAAGGTAPDVAMSAPVYVRSLAEAKVYQPIDELAKKEKGWLDAYYPASLDTFRVRGKLYGVWHYANPQVVFFNQELLTQAGVKAPPADWTYQQWLDLAKPITKHGDPASAVWGTAAPTSFNYVFNAIRSYGGSVFDNDDDPKKFTGTDARTIDGLQFLADLLLTHRVAPTAADKAGQGNLMFSGRLGFSTEIAVSIGDYRKQMKQSWDVAQVPRGPAGRSCFFGANGTAFTVPGNRNPAPGWAFLKFLGGPAGQKEYLAEFGAVPTLRALAESDFVHQAPPPATLKALTDAMSYIKPLPKLPTLDLQKTIDGAFQAIFSGQKGAKAAMSEIETSVNQALRG